MRSNLKFHVFNFDFYPDFSDYFENFFIQKPLLIYKNTCGGFSQPFQVIQIFKRIGKRPLAVTHTVRVDYFGGIGQILFDSQH